MDPKEAARKGNVSKGGRYGSAAADEPHMQPETAPLGRDDIEARLPDHTLAGSLPENKGDQEPYGKATEKKER